MNTVILTRTQNLPDGTFGVANLEGRTWMTVERPWLDNKDDVSCIPVGSYICRWTHSPRLDKFTYEVTDVKDRTGIRIHSANLPHELMGCIALGESLGLLGGQKCVLQSKIAVEEFNKLMNAADFILSIVLQGA